jgi:hypothetical protein
MGNWIQNLIALISGGVIWEGIKFFYPDVQKRISNLREAKKQLNENIDPILKSCDELYGKLYSLSLEDFATFINEKNSNSDDTARNRKYVYYLFAQFWAHLEYIRMKSQYSSIVRTRKGKILIRFIEAYESREFRILDRSVQRMIGEALIENSNGPFRVMSMNNFYSCLNDKSNNISIWIDLLEKYFLSTRDKNKRQQILVFGVIVAVLIDYFDPNHKIVRRRKIYINKLNNKSKKKIERNLLNHYLPFIESKEIYLKEKKPPPDIYVIMDNKSFGWLSLS